MSLQVAWSTRQSKDAYVSIPPHGELHPFSFPNHNGQVVRGELKAPALDTVKHVLSTLVGSTKEENAETLLIHAQDSHYSLNEQARLAELIKVACQSLIREADVQASELRRSHEAAALEYRRKLALETANANHQRNWQAPIIQLPVEVFSNILFISLAGFETSRVERLRELASVAKHWRDVIAATARLWAVAAEAMSAEEVALILKQSKGVKLDVILSAYHLRPEFIPTLVPLVSRWRSLKIPTSRLDTVVFSLRFDARQLEEIHIFDEEYFSPPSPSKRLELCEGTHFLLVNTCQVVLPWDSNRLTRLVSLRLEGMYGDKVPSVQQILAILRASPTLESLAISNSDIKVDDESMTSHAPDSSLIQLPDLLDLQLSSIQSQICQGILSRIRMTKCKTIQINPRRSAEQSDSEPIDYEAPNVVEAISSSLRLGPRLHIYISSEYVTVISSAVEICFSGPGVHLLWKAGQGKMAITRTMEKVTRLIGRACPKARTDLDLTSSDLPKGFEIDFLRGLPGVESIHVGSDLGEEVLRYLSCRFTNAKGEEEWPCPHLKKLDLGRLQAYGIADIRKWVSGRWTKHKDTGGPAPEGTVAVNTPHGKSGATEKWRPTEKAKKRR